MKDTNKENVNQKGNLSALHGLVSKTCDCCEETWEEDFFCDKCSGLQLEKTEELQPKLFYDGYGSDMEYVESEDFVFMNVCGNCCTCHMKNV